MIKEASVYKQLLEAERRKSAEKVLSEEKYLEEEIDKAIKMGLDCVYVEPYQLTNKTTVVMSALEVFGFRVDITTHTRRLMVMWSWK